MLIYIYKADECLFACMFESLLPKKLRSVCSLLCNDCSILLQEARNDGRRKVVEWFCMKLLFILLKLFSGTKSPSCLLSVVVKVNNMEYFLVKINNLEWNDETFSTLFVQPYISWPAFITNEILLLKNYCISRK